MLGAGPCRGSGDSTHAVNLEKREDMEETAVLLLGVECSKALPHLSKIRAIADVGAFFRAINTMPLKLVSQYGR